MTVALKQRICEVECPECEFQFSVEKPMVGEVLACPDCQLNLLVTATLGTQVEVELTETDAEDWGQ